MKVSILLFYLLLVSTSLAMLMPEIISPFDNALEACEQGLEETATVCDVSGHHPNMFPCFCDTDPGFGSIVDCFVKGYDNKTEFIDAFIKRCDEEANITFTKQEFWKKYEDVKPKLKNTLDIPNFNITELTDSPVLLDYDYFANVKEYNYIDNMNKNYGQYFGYALMGYWVLVLSIATIVNWTIHLFPGFTNIFIDPISNMFRKYVTLPATFNRRKANAYRFGYLIPSRMETVILTCFTFLIAIFSGIKIKNVPVKDVPKDANLAKLVAVRTGILVGFICPFLVLFAGRNNFLQWLTRWNFATFITYHRWVSRLVVLLVIIHAITFTIRDKMVDHYLSHMAHPFVRWGVVAGVAGGIILVQGLLYVRRKSYELFLIIHILMALFFIVGGYKHTIVFGYAPFYWTSIAIWAFDRAIRFSRLFVFGAPTADVTLLAEETLRVVIPKPSYWHAVPGGHAFIHFLKPSCFWQSHPFTFTDSSEKGNYIVMYIKLKGGVTHGVYKYLNKFPGRTSKIRVLVEGPYGESSSARKYKNAVFIAGGNGIPGIYSECIDIARRNPSSPRLKLIWIIREWKSLSWFFHELKVLNTTNVDTTIYVTKPDLNLEHGLSHFKGVIDSDNSSVEVEKNFVNSKEKSDEEKSEQKSEEKNTDTPESTYASNNEFETQNVNSYELVDAIKEELSHITFKEGRPNMEELIHQEVVNADGTLAFVTCGHPVMVDDIRYNVAANLHESKYRVEYFEQLQVWA